MKLLAFIPIVVLLATGIAFGVCKITGHPLYVHEILCAAVACTIAGEFAFLPPFLLRKSDSGTVSQAGLVGTVVHMFLTLLLSAIVWMSHLIDVRKVFLLALVGFFWITLLTLVLLLARLVRNASQASPGQPR